MSEYYSSEYSELAGFLDEFKLQYVSACVDPYVVTNPMSGYKSAQNKEFT